MEDENLQKLERKLREYNEIDWVLVANVMTEVADLGYPAIEDTAIDSIVRLHEQGKVRVGTYINGAPGGFVGEVLAHSRLTRTEALKTSRTTPARRGRVWQEKQANAVHGGTHPATPSSPARAG